MIMMMMANKRNKTIIPNAVVMPVAPIDIEVEHHAKKRRKITALPRFFGKLCSSSSSRYQPIMPARSGRTGCV